MFAIETKDLSFAYSARYKAVNNISLQVPDQCIYGFLGPNGAGKTTTIRLLAAMLLSDSDNVFIQGKSLQKQRREIFRSVGMLIETPSLYLHLSGEENLKIITTLRDIHPKVISEILAQVGLTDAAKVKVGKYSLGMKQRLGIGMALLPQPQLLVLDEPANGLDPNGIIEIRELLITLNKEHGKTVFVSSHLLTEVEKMCSHIGIINKGVMKYQGTLQNMKETAYASGEVLFKIPNTSEYIHTVQNAFPQARQVSQDEMLFSFMDQQEVTTINRTLVNQNIPVTGIHVRGGLEDWFMQIIDQNNK